MKNFNIPEKYRSSFITTIKNARKLTDPLKRDFSPTLLDFGPLRFFLARHFGFCYGVENAIEISYNAIGKHPGKRIFLLSQMIHNPEVNGDLQNRGIEFIMDTEGKQFIPWEELTPEDIVIIPAFGTSIETKQKLEKAGVDVHQYNTTCPFVEKVWKKAAQLAKENCTVIIHGKHMHEETRATFSHSNANGPSLIIRDRKEAKMLADIILGKRSSDDFYRIFKGRHSKGFDVTRDLQKTGVVNQTTMLASETNEIAQTLSDAMKKKYGEEKLHKHFVSTRDTLCYATNDNQEATVKVLSNPADIAIVVGGYNSSNTSHIVELCEAKLPTYFISSASEIISKDEIRHYHLQRQTTVTSRMYLPAKEPVNIILTSGASCPDTMVEDVLNRICSFFGGVKPKEELLARLMHGRCNLP